MPAKGDGSEVPATESDAGVDDNGNGGNNGGDTEGSTGGTNGAGNEDAGAAAPSDGGAPGLCPWSSTPGDAGMGAATCAGTHCTLMRAQLVSALGSVCESSDSLDAVCAGDSLRVVQNCWRTNLGTPDRASVVKSCAAADPALAKLNSNCLDCYVALHECLSLSCALECASESSTTCEPCANQNCVPAFAACSGLATP